MAVDNPLDKDKLPNLEVSQRNELLLCFFFDWFSVFVDAMSTLPVQDEGGAWPCGLLLCLLRGPLRLGSLGGLRDSTLCTSSDGGGSEEVRSWGSWWGWIGHIESDK